MIPYRLRRAAVAAGAVAAVALAGTAAAGCANSDALALARQACGHVQRSIDLYRQAGSAPSPTEQQAKTVAAMAELRQALPLAATAAGEAPEWQALMTTLSESSRVPESLLVHALQLQCADARAGGQPALPPSSTVPATTPTLPDVGQ